MLGPVWLVMLWRLHASAQAWRSESPALAPTTFGCAAADATGKVYVFGGSDPVTGKPSNVTQVFDPKTATWNWGAPMPVAIEEPGAALGPNGKIYVMGGDGPGPGRHARSSNFEYDPILQFWKTRRPMPTARAALAVVAARDQRGKTIIYAIGGRDFKDPRNGLETCEGYDPETDTWKTMAPMPSFRHALAGALGPDGRIYVVGGACRDPIGGPHFSNEVDVYDPRRNAWSVVTQFPHPIECALVSATTGRAGRFYVFGGWYSPDKRDERELYAYDPKSREWSDCGAGPFACAAGVAASSKSGILFLSNNAHGESALLVPSR